MSYSQTNYLETYEYNENNIWGDNLHTNSSCQSCKSFVGRKNDLCDHGLCDACREKSMCDVCKATNGNPSEFKFTENYSYSNLTLPNGRNEFSGFNFPYEGKQDETLLQPHTRISPQSRYNFHENKEESHQFTVPSPQFISSSSFYTSQISRMPNRSQEYRASPSPPTNDFLDGFNKINISQSITIPLQIDYQNSESQRNLSHSGSHQEKEHIGYDNVQTLPLNDQYSYLSNSPALPTHSSEFSPGYIANNGFQTQNISNNNEREVEELKGISISTCDHKQNEWFCCNCRQYLCFNCTTHHKDHLCFPKSEELKIHAGFDILLGERIYEIKENMMDVIGRSKAEKSKLKKNRDSCLKQIESHSDDLKKELSMRENIIKNNIGIIVGSKFSMIQPPLIYLDGRENDTIPHETGDIYLKRTNENTCQSIIKEFGLIYGSSCSEKMHVAGIALSKIIINHPCGFIVQGYDALGNKCFSGGEDIKATLTGPNKETCDVEIRDLQNGLYQGIVSTQVKGNHKLSITLRGNTIFENEYILKSKYYMDLQTIFTNRYSRHKLVQTFNYCFRDMHCDENGRLFITDTKTHCVHIFDHELKKLKSFGGPGEADGEFKDPHGITVDNEKRIIVVDSGNHRVQVFSYDGEFKFKFGSLGSEKSHFKSPEGVATDSEGNIAVADKENNRIQLYDKFGNYITVTKSNSNSRAIEGPNGLYFDDDDTLFVTRLGYRNMPLVKYKLIRNSFQVQFEKDYESVCLPEYEIKEPLALIKKNEYYILSSSPKIRDDRESSLYFHNTRTHERRVISFEGKTPYGIALSPEGHLYISFINHRNSMSELYLYEWPKYE